MSHIPVMKEEVIEYLEPQSGRNYVDCTFGLGGHSKAILEMITPGGCVIGIEQDNRTLKAIKDKLEKEWNDYCYAILVGNFRRVQKLVSESGFTNIYGVLFDLGISSRQLDTAQIGLSFRQAEPLDMRLSQAETELTAAEIVNEWSVNEMVKIFKDYGEERHSLIIAKAIDRYRHDQELSTTQQLAELVSRSIPRKLWPPHIHPATRIFQALRIAVNDELGALEAGLKQSLEILEPGGRIVVISYHSLEDRIVKQFFKQEAQDCICPKEFPICNCGHQAALKILTKKPLTPSEDEIAANPRSRSAKMRVAEKI